MTKLRAVLSDYPHVAALKDGTVARDGLGFEFVEYDPVHKAFAAMVREQAFDLCEMAIVTYLQARASGKPLVLLPVVLRSRFQHGHLVCRADRPVAPGDLAGRRVGVRTYSQTTGVWLRGILADDHGVDLDAVRWVSIADGHLAEFRDPPGVERAPDGSSLLEMLHAGELDAVMLGQDLPDDPRLRPVIADPDGAARDWYSRHGAVPINHMMVVRPDTARRRPGLVAELTDMFAEAKRHAPAVEGIDMVPQGFAANRPALDLITGYAHRQGLLARPLDPAELFATAPIEEQT